METIDKIHALQEEIQECNRAMAATYDDCNAEQNAARLKYYEQMSKLRNERRDLITMMEKKISDAAYAYNRTNSDISTKYKVRRMEYNERISKAKTEISILKLKMFKDNEYKPDEE
jgi:hypothetical protein